MPEEDSALAAIAAVDFAWTRHLQSVWEDADHHVEEINGRLADEIVEDAVRCNRPADHSPIGRVVVGQAGAGKTHLMGEVRRRIWKRGGWFVLLDLADVNDFWPTTALGYLQSLQQPFAKDYAQGDRILLKLRESVRAVDEALGRNVTASTSSREIAELIVNALRKEHPTETRQHREVIRAFVMLMAREPDISDEAYSWLQGVQADGNHFGQVKSARDVVRGLSWLMSLAGPTVLAVDQIDAIVSVHNHALDAEGEAGANDERRRAMQIIDGLAGGLMDLYDTTRRTLTVLSSLEATWEILKAKAVASWTGRFREEPAYVQPIADGSAGLALVTRRLAAAYGRGGFTPPYPSWPFHPDAFQRAAGLTARELLKRCDAHVRRCLRQGRVTELRHFDEGPPPSVSPPASGLAERFASLRERAPVERFADIESAEKPLADLLLDALRCYTLQVELPDDVDLLVEEDPHKRKPALHARLRHVYRAQGDREEHHCFRAIPHANAIAFQSRLRAAVTAAGIDMALRFRHLVVIRRGPPPAGPKTQAMCRDFEQAGGRFAPLDDNDLRTLMALQAMLKERPEGFEAWLKQWRPLCDVALFRAAGLCGEAEERAERRGEAEERSAKAEARTSARSVAKPASLTPPSRAIPIGRRLTGGEVDRLRSLALELLPRHTAVLAGSGSGKTVLLRRIVEEVALLGMPAIVLDTNNDLARLGDPWPQEPADWDAGDRAKARAYHERADVVVWTPGISGGRPIVLAPLPDFAAVRSDPDELQQAIHMAYAALQPLIGAGGAKGPLKQGVLMEALGHFAKSGAGDLEALVRLLSDLPEEVSKISGARKLAADIADRIKAEMAKNPLLGRKGTPLDPQVLFTSERQNRTRISVINFSGLESDEARQAFVNQLEMALFSWIKRHPAPLRGLLVMDEAQNFAPAQKSTPCKESTLALVSQARKYGLGLVFATQVPKAIDNKIVSNCTTHFYGRMNSPATIEAIRELMAAKGARGDDIATLRTGEFYFSTEGTPPEKLKTPLCLSHHPPNPLSREEVVARARRSAG